MLPIRATIINWRYSSQVSVTTSMDRQHDSTASCENWNSVLQDVLIRSYTEIAFIKEYASPRQHRRATSSDD